MDYLDIVNKTLRRMRESPVSSLYENKQSSVIAELVNDAKREVEQAHNWSALRQDVAFSTVGGTTSYSLDDTQNRATIMDVRDITNNAILQQVSASWIRRRELISDSPGQSRPSYWASEGIDTNGDNVIKLWPTPDAEYQIRSFCIIRTPDLEAEGDQLVIPAQPVLMLTRSMAMQERGDVDEMDIRIAEGRANKSLAQHIMFDAGLNPDEQIWGPE